MWITRSLSDLSVTNDFGLVISVLLSTDGFGFEFAVFILFCLLRLMFWLNVAAADADLFTIAPDGFISTVVM